MNIDSRPNLSRSPLTVSFLFVASVFGRADETTGNRPNFVFVLTDDQSPETLSAYGKTVCETPHLDRLAAEGIVLTDAHHMGVWSGAVCTPSRTMIMTGRTVWRIPGARGPGLKWTKKERRDAAQMSLPAIFNQAGYDTFRTCKRGNSYKEANDLFRISKIASKREGTQEGGSQWHGDRVIEYLDDRVARQDKDPFLIYFGFSHPHDPRHATDELAKKYGVHNDGPPPEPDPKSPPLPSNYLPAHPFPHGHPGLRDEERVQGVLTRRDPITVRNELGREYACIENIDVQVGRLLEKLEAMGELDNTYVIFTSDHGIAVGRHGLMGKQNLYEHTWRVPMIVRGPGIKAGRRASGYVYLLDVLPTLCDLAGIKIPEIVEGKSMRSVLEGKRERIRDVLYGVYCGGTKPGMRAIKTGDWKLIQYDLLDGTVRRTQLFHLRDNPREFLKQHHAPELRRLISEAPQKHQVNLADAPEHAGKRRELERLLREEMRRLGDPYELQ